MKKTLWMPQAAVSHYAEVKSGYEQPVLSANVTNGQTQLSADAIQFGFCVYEGMRVYIVDNQYLVFRSRDHHERMAQSCAALAMPCPSYDTFIEAIKLIVECNYNENARRLYIRPIVFAASGGIMPQQDQSYTYAALCTTFDPDIDGLKVLVETENPRTVPAFSAVKTATNYTSSALITRQAQNLGYDTVLVAGQKRLHSGMHHHECLPLRKRGDIHSPTCQHTSRCHQENDDRATGGAGGQCGRERDTHHRDSRRDRER